jgi:TonB family protein
MKIKSYRLLFRILSFLSDKTHGFPLFANYKLMLGTLILGLSASSCSDKKANTQTTCYEVEAVKDSTQMVVADTTKSDTIQKEQQLIDSKYVTCYFTPPVITCYNTDVVEQEVEVDTTAIYDHVEQMPSFPGGDKALYKWFETNLKYPDASIKDSIQGRVVVRFVVRKDGSISDVEILRSLDPSCDKEAVRVIKNMPKWIPGKQNGKNVDVYFTLPILFKLQ